jgi:uncharacterized protein involved in exopolysaccharide biosynthesis
VLAEIRDRYSDEHPDVLVLRAQIEALADQMSEKVGGQTRPVEPTNPAYIQLVTRIDTSRAQLESLQAKRRELESKRTEVELRIAKTPTIERDFSQLSRDYRNATVKFAEVKAKQKEAELAEALEEERKGEKFTLIDPPQVPETPVSPNRWLIFSIGAILALVAGFVTVFAWEALDSRIADAVALQRFVGAMPLVSIPIIETDVGHAATLRRGWIVGVSGVALAGLLGLLGVHVFVIPIDAALAIVLTRLGF